MTIGVLPDSNRSIGGAYFYSFLVLESLAKIQRAGAQDQLIAFLETGDSLPGPQFSDCMRVEPVDPLGSRMKAHLRESAWLQAPLRWYRGARRRPSVKHAAGNTQRNIDYIHAKPEQQNRLRGFGIDLMVYACQTTRSFESGVPFMMPIHDLQHRLQNFPELTGEGEFASREYLFRNAARHASAILADSEVGKEDILNCYGDVIEADRIEVVPYAPVHRLEGEVRRQEVERILRSYSLPERFFFYPAQFWPHKNHERIVRALAQIKETRNAAVHMVFAGSHSGEIRERNFQDVMRVARELGVADQVVSLGYVPDADIPPLYAASEGLIMPTFFGPTNIPVLEAWAIGCPVLTSDIRGIREQSGDAAVLVDPASVDAIADGISRLWTDQSLRRRLVEKGTRRVRQFSPEEFTRRFHVALENAKERIVREGKFTTSCRLQ